MHCEQLILALPSMRKKNDRKVARRLHDGTFGPEGDNVLQTCCFAWKGSTPRLNSLLFKNSTSVLPPRWMAVLQRTIASSLWI